MTSRRSILLSLVLGAFLGVFGLNSVYAQVPRSISYQGLLVKNNQPVTGQVSIDVKIYDAANTVLYQETQSQVQVTNGIFNILLGGNSGTLPASLKFDEQYYLGVNVDGTGEVKPTTPFVAAPYALNAQTVGGVGVSVTPQPGMLLPLDQNGKIPKAVLPQATQTLSMINNLTGDNNGNVAIVTGNPATLTVTNDAANNKIVLTAIGGGGGFRTFHAGPGLQVVVNQNINDTSVTYSLLPNGITNGMLGTGVVTGMKLDQFVAGNGLYQDQLGNLNVGHDNSISIIPNLNPAKNNGAIGINMFNANIWQVLQTFNGGITVNGTTTLNGPVINSGPAVFNGTLTVNGTPEPLAAPNAATYEITDNGDLLVTGSTTTRGNTYIGIGPTNNANQMGLAGSSANTITGATNAINATTSNNIQSPTNNIGTTNAGSANTIGNAGSSTNTITGATNSTIGSTSNSSQAPTINVGTSQAAGGIINQGTAGITTNNQTGVTNSFIASTSNDMQSPVNRIGTTNAGSSNTIGNPGTSTNTATGANNFIIGTSSNNSQAPTVNAGTTQVAGGVVNIGTAGVTTVNINGLQNNVQAQTNNLGTSQLGGGVNNIGTAGNTTNNITGLTNNVTGTTNNLNAATNNLGTAPPGSINNIGNATSTNAINGTTTFNGNVIHNGNITQTSGTTSLLGTTITGPLTQSGGNAAIAGGAVNSFGTVAGSANSIGGAGSTNTFTGQNTFNGNINQTAGTTTLLNTTTGNLQVNGTLGSTGNLTLGTTSTNNTIGTAGAINTLQGATNNFTASTANNFTGDIIQISGRVSIAPTAGTTNNFGNAASQINNFGTGASTTNNIGTGAGDVTNIGTVSGGGISTTNIGNLNAGTNNNLNGLTTVQFTGDQTYLRVAGGVASCAGVFPTGAQSELLVNGDGWFDGTVAACRLNIFGVNASCIANLNTTNFGSCGGPGVPINLISSIIGVPSGAGATDLTNMRNIQASTNIQTNVTLTIGVPGTNATNITSSNPGPGTINQQTPTVSGKLPTFQAYTLPLVPASGINGGGSVTFNAGNAPGINLDAVSGITATYQGHNAGIPVGELWVTRVPGVSVTVESSAAGDNNQVQIIILRP